MKAKALVAQLCPTLWDPMDYNWLGSSVHEVVQARILEWVATPSSRGSPWPKDRTWVSCIAGRFFTMEVPRKIFFKEWKKKIGKERNAWWLKKKERKLSLKPTPVDCFLKVVKARWPLGSGGICHRSYANILLLGPECGEKGPTASGWQNRQCMLPPEFLPNLFWPFSLMAFHEMHFTGSTFMGWRRDISIYVIFNSLQGGVLLTHKTTCFYLENVDIGTHISTYGVRT